MLRRTLKGSIAGAVTIICLLPTQGSSLLKGPSPTAGSSPAEERSPAAAETTPAPGAPPIVEIPLRADDKYEFLGDYYASASTAAGGRAPGVLLIPDLAQDRKHMSRLAARLRDSGYNVLAMDNTGHMRKVSKRVRGVRSVTMFDTEILSTQVLDATAAGDAIRSQPGVSSSIGVVGFGMGANLATLYVGKNQSISVVAIVFPSYDCKKFDPLEAFGNINLRPALLLDTVKRTESDLSRAWNDISRYRKDLTHLTVTRPPGESETAVTAAEDDVSRKLLDWLSRTLPVPKS